MQKKPANFGSKLFPADLATTDITGEVAWIYPAPTPKIKGLHLAAVEDLNATISALDVPTTPLGWLTNGTGVKPKAGKFTTNIPLPTIAKPVTGRGIYRPKCNSAWGFSPRHHGRRSHRAKQAATIESRLFSALRFVRKTP